jgi:Ser/Thr protein kinase RdoA (MazF antagonist)
MPRDVSTARQPGSSRAPPGAGRAISLAVLPTTLRVAVRRECGAAVVTATELGAGQNNRLFRLTTGDGAELLAKLYHQDDRDRLGREFGILRFLGERGFIWTPRALLRDGAGAWAVYSFERGTTKPAAAYTVDDGRALGQFAAALHAFRPDDDNAGFDLCINPTPSLAAAIERIGARLGMFLADETARSHDRVRAFLARFDPAPTIEELTARATAGLARDEIARRLPREQWRLTTCDAGPHNVLVRADGGITVVDWEYAGWDDPMALPVGFATHVTSLGLPPAALAALERTYLDLVDPTATGLTRLGHLRRLVEVE